MKMTMILKVMQMKKMKMKKKNKITKIKQIQNKNNLTYNNNKISQKKGRKNNKIN